MTKSELIDALAARSELTKARAELVVNCVFDAMTEARWAAGLPTNALLVSGPSKTADIQQTLAYGAHGPKELIVLMVQP